jgi:hypothetical protein
MRARSTAADISRVLRRIFRALVKRSWKRTNDREELHNPELTLPASKSTVTVKKLRETQSSVEGKNAYGGYQY